MTTSYYHDGWRVLTDIQGSTRRNYVWENYLDEALMMVVSNTTTYYFGHDHRYSPVVVYDSYGIAIERMDYDAYGRMLYRLTPDFNNDGYVNMADYVILMQAGQVFD